MKAYRLKSSTGSVSFQRTQAEAKRIAKLDGLDMELVEVPTAQQELIYFLNDLAAEQRSLGRQTGMREAAPATDTPPNDDPPEERRKQIAAGLLHPPVKDWTADEIEEFVLCRATVAQVENIFATLGTRFAEARRVSA